ncbi:MAG TPA: hypothetical protein VF932_00110 [Anaerolineae bacterium]
METLSGSAVQAVNLLPPPDLRESYWWKPRTIAVLNPPTPGDRVQESFLPQLLAAFAAQGHTVLPEPNGTVHLMLAFFDLAESNDPLVERVPERHLPLALTMMRDYGLSKRPENLVLFLTVSRRLSPMPHRQVLELARTVMGRIGVPKVVFLSGNRETGRLDEATFCTMEGGHPSDATDIANRLRDRLVTACCARDVGNEYEVVPNAIAASTWERSRTPEALIEAGHRMAALGLLPPPKKIGEYVSPELARIYQRYLGMKGFSEGMLFAFDPPTRTLMVTASGSWEVDKRALKREEIVPIAELKDGKVQVWAPEGIQPKGPSVEALEVYSLVSSVPTVRVTQNAQGDWVLDPAGEVTVPVIRAGVHVHVGVAHVDETWVENVPTNRRAFAYGFGCGTDLMMELAQDAARRSRAIMDPTDPRGYVRWQMLYHGDTAVELWKPGVPAQTLAGLLDMYDPTRVGAIQYTPDHIEQPE